MIDRWEIANPTDEQAIWRLVVGQDAENASETAYQVDTVLSGIPPGERALEVGCGVGRLLKAVYLTGRFRGVTGVDSSISLSLVSERYLDGVIGDVAGCRVMLTDGFRLPFPDATFDFCFSFTCFQHMPSLATIHRNLTEIRRVLVPGGLCRIQTIASGTADPHDTELFDGRVFKSKESFAERFVAVGMEVISAEQGLTNEQHIWVTARKAG